MVLTRQIKIKGRGQSKESILIEMMDEEYGVVANAVSAFIREFDPEDLNERKVLDEFIRRHEVLSKDIGESEQEAESEVQQEEKQRTLGETDPAIADEFYRNVYSQSWYRDMKRCKC